MPQRLVVDVADGALPCRAGVRHDNVHAAEGFHRVAESRLYILRFRHVAGERDRGFAAFARDGTRHRAVAIEHCHFRARACHGFCRRGTNPRAAAGDHGHLARERFFRSLAELRLFERPVLDIEHVGLGNRLIAADGFRVRDYLDGIFGDVGGDRRILRRVTEAEQSFARHQRHARIRIEFRFLRLGARVIAREIVMVARDEIGYPFFDRGFPFVEFVCYGRGQEKRPVLGADAVIGRDHACL